MKNTKIEFENLGKHLDESLSNFGGEDDSNIDGDDYSNARGGGGGGRRGGGGGRMGGGGGGGRRFGGGGAVARHRNYVRRNYYGGGYGWGWGGYPYGVGIYPPIAYYYDAENPKTIKVTKAGLEYLKKNPKGVNGYFLTAIKDGNTHNEATLKDSLQLSDFNRVMSWMHGNKFIDFV
jgi:hypothetical protein